MHETPPLPRRRWIAEPERPVMQSNSQRLSERLHLPPARAIRFVSLFGRRLLHRWHRLTPVTAFGTGASRTIRYARSVDTSHDRTIDHHLPQLRLRQDGEHAAGRLPLFLRMPALPHPAPAEAGRLLRLLFLRFGRMPAAAIARCRARRGGLLFRGIKPPPRRTLQAPYRNGTDLRRFLRRDHGLRTRRPRPIFALCANGPTCRSASSPSL